MERFGVVTFDCYGTLVDWEGGAAAFLYDMALRRAGTSDPAAAVLPSAAGMRERWERIQFGLVAAAYRPYKEILADSLAAVTAEYGWPATQADKEAFVRSMRSWQPFPDTRPALAAARALGARLAIISNTDRDIIAHTLRHLEVPFDEVITAEDCRAYKPDPAVFRRAVEVIGAPPARILHVAFGFEYDNAPARAAGMRTAWVNRSARARPSGEVPDFEWRDLWPLLDVLG
ncbi:MAG TPA: haloacid dehalogenase type II [Streptosporangiaceae bacterium]|nr:haloacid dehalogenase type II [Streptosporangiaceae bacterium]